MDLSAFQAADTAVKKIAKDYKPIVDLSDALDQVRVVLNEVGELENARERAKVELSQLVAAKSQAEAELAKVKRETAQAEGILNRVKSALSGIKL